jgi:hypothetical protein
MPARMATVIGARRHALLMAIARLLVVVAVALPGRHGRGTGSSCTVYLCIDLIGFSGDVFFNIYPVLCEVWDPSNQLRAECSFKLPLKLLKMVAYDVKNELCSTWVILQTLCD